MSVSAKANPTQHVSDDVEIIYFDCRHKVLANKRAYVIAITTGADPAVRGLPIGLLSIEQIGDYAWLNDLFVDRSRRQSGIGLALVRHAIEVVPTEFPEATHLGCGVQIFNDASRALFKKAGFIEEREYHPGTLLCTRPIVEDVPVDGVIVPSFGRGL